MKRWIQMATTRSRTCLMAHGDNVESGDESDNGGIPYDELHNAFDELYNKFV